MFLYPTAVALLPHVVLQIPNAVVVYPTPVQAVIVPVMTPVASVRVPPVELLRSPNDTPAKPPVDEKFCLPTICEFKAQDMFLYPEAIEYDPEAVLHPPKADE